MESRDSNGMSQDGKQRQHQNGLGWKVETVIGWVRMESRDSNGLGWKVETVIGWVRMESRNSNRMGQDGKQKQ